MSPVSASPRFSHDRIAFVRIAVLISVLAGAAHVHAQPTGRWSMTGSLATWDGRQTGITPPVTATLLENNQVLVVGGIGAELYDPSTGEWSATGRLITPRYGHIAVRLADGKVLVAGGIRTDYSHYEDRVLSSAEIYNPVTGAWQPTGNFSVPREGHTANLLPNGTVLVIGGRNYHRGSGWFTHSSAEIYDPRTGAWYSACTMRSPRVGHASIMLATGYVLVIGGFRGGIGIRDAELLDLESCGWTRTGNLIAARAAPVATLLPDGQVLVAGGGGDVICDGVSGQLCAVDTAELYDPVTGQWSATGSMTDRRADHAVTLLPDGRVLVAGGHRGDVVYDACEGRFYDPNLDACVTVLRSAELYDPVTGGWTTTGDMNAFRYGHTATLLANGNVLVAGGWVFGSGRNAAEVEMYER